MVSGNRTEISFSYDPEKEDFKPDKEKEQKMSSEKLQLTFQKFAELLDTRFKSSI